MAVLSLCALASAQFNAGRLESVKLLTPQTGWAATNEKLFWTNDAGSPWTDITPPAPSRGEDAASEIASIFFLDATNGWVLFSRYEEPEPRFDLASTTNAGASWSIARVSIPGLNPASTIVATDARMFFLDAAQDGST